MAQRILHVARTGTATFPRFVICDHLGKVWTGSTWGDRPSLYADQHFVSNDCADLQRRELAAMKVTAAVEVPIRFEIFGHYPVDPEQLQSWLRRHVHLEIDISGGPGPNSDNIVLGVVDWPRYATTC